jgi:hypothetical protein
MNQLFSDMYFEQTSAKEAIYIGHAAMTDAG